MAGGETVWLAWGFEHSTGIRYDTGSPGRADSGQTWSGEMPDPFGNTTQSDIVYSIYAIYTAEDILVQDEIADNEYLRLSDILQDFNQASGHAVFSYCFRNFCRAIILNRGSMISWWPVIA